MGFDIFNLCFGGHHFHMGIKGNGADAVPVKNNHMVGFF